MILLRFRFFILFFGLMNWAMPSVSSHTIGNFSINHYARFGAQGNQMSLRYILDFAEIPTAERMPQLDTNGDNQVSASEKASYLKTQPAIFLNGLSLRIDERKIALEPRKSDLEVRAGAGGLPTLRVWMDCTVPLAPAQTARVEYQDSNFSNRTGWREIIAVADKGRAIRESNASSADRSRGLTVFPSDAAVVSPRQSRAAFSVIRAGVAASSTKPSDEAKAPSNVSSNAPTTYANTPQNRFTQTIAQKHLTPGLVLGGLLVALAFGAVHALSPGHGKTMVAAYLVGSRGTPRHAVTLGFVVTLTHTFGVFALGFGLLFASRYIVPERLFPALSALSGLLIFGVGLWLFMSRWQGLSTKHGHEHSHDGHTHGHSHDGHDHTHSPGVHTHSHGGRAHSHAVPDGPITTKTLVALGISGGIVPCPEALVVLLAAVKLHRIGYGLLLITAFSVGLAAALIAIGLLVVSARQRLSRFEGLGESSALVRFLPLGSAAVITLIGAALTLQATLGAP